MTQGLQYNDPFAKPHENDILHGNLNCDDILMSAYTLHVCAAHELVHWVSPGMPGSLRYRPIHAQNCKISSSQLSSHQDQEHL